MTLTALLLSAALATSAPSDQEAYLEGCVNGGDTEAVCLCTLDHLQRSYTPSEFQLTMAMMVAGMTGDKKRTTDLVKLFGGDLEAFGSFARDGRSVLDKAFIGCRQEAEE